MYHQRLFVEGIGESNPAGVYKLRFCKSGQWQDVLVDDRFPCKIDPFENFDFADDAVEAMIA